MRQLERERERGKDQEPESGDVGKAAQRLDRAQPEARVRPSAGVAGDEQHNQRRQLQIHAGRLLSHRRSPGTHTRLQRRKRSLPRRWRPAADSVSPGNGLGPAQCQSGADVRQRRQAAARLPSRIDHISAHRDALTPPH